MNVRIPETGLKCKIVETVERQTFTYGPRLFSQILQLQQYTCLLKDIGTDIKNNKQNQTSCLPVPINN